MNRLLMQHSTLAVIAVTGMLAGCDTDQRYFELAQQSVARQAEQNKEIAQQSQRVAEASHELVQADARARADLLAAQQSLEAGLQAERSRLDAGRDQLAVDRQQLAEAIQREPLIAQALWSVALLSCAVLPVILCIYLLRALAASDPGQDLGELLVHELAADQSVLLPPPAPKVPRLEQDAPQLGNESQS